MPFVYILKCSDGSYYVGSTTNLEKRLAEHQTGFFKGYTESRRPVELVWSAEMPNENEAFLFERQIKGWSRAKKEAPIRGDWDRVHLIVKQERKEREAKKRQKIR
jgi:predicted GIY-YIG superfamily endonuclease